MDKSNEVDIIFLEKKVNELERTIDILSKKQDDMEETLDNHRHTFWKGKAYVKKIMGWDG